MNDLAVAAGRFFFRHRNWAFPVLIAAIFAVGAPPARILGSEALEHAKDGLAILVALAGLALRALVIGYRHVSRAGRNRTIHAGALYTTEIFALCRNPLYTGNLLIVAGALLMHGDPLAMALGSAVFLMIYGSMVAAEERYLHATFGPVYAEYCARVPRWIPDLRRLPDAVRGARFDIRRVLIVEYTNVGVTALVLLAAEFLEEAREPVVQASHLWVLAGLAVLALAWIAGVRVLKKRRIVVPA